MSRNIDVEKWSHTVIDDRFRPFDGKSIFLRFTYDMYKNHMVMTILNGDGDVLETRDVEDGKDLQDIYNEVYQHMAKELLNSNQ